jgi:hypothetical protein
VCVPGKAAIEMKSKVFERIVKITGLSQHWNYDNYGTATTLRSLLEHGGIPEYLLQLPYLLKRTFPLRAHYAHATSTSVLLVTTSESFRG